jgi:hypothetical protein
MLFNSIFKLIEIIQKEIFEYKQHDNKDEVKDTLFLVDYLLTLVSME